MTKQWNSTGRALASH